MPKLPWSDPDKDFILTKDHEVKTLLASLNLIQVFAGGGALPKPAVKCAASAGFKSHWIFAVRFSGHVDASENGYQLWGWSKRHHSVDDVNRYISEFWKSQGGGSSGAMPILNEPELN